MLTAVVVVGQWRIDDSTGHRELKGRAEIGDEQIEKVSCRD
jgi:hypothetical protein